VAHVPALGHQVPRLLRADELHFGIKTSISSSSLFTPTLLADVSDFIFCCIQIYNGEDHRRLDHRSRWNETIHKDVGGKPIQDRHYSNVDYSSDRPLPTSSFGVVACKVLFFLEVHKLNALF
jgi:hypothetical protein